MTKSNRKHLIVFSVELLYSRDACSGSATDIENDIKNNLLMGHFILYRRPETQNIVIVLMSRLLALLSLTSNIKIYL